MKIIHLLNKFFQKPPLVELCSLAWKELQGAALWTLKILSVSRAGCNMYILADFILLTKQTQTIGHRKEVLIEIL